LPERLASVDREMAAQVERDAEARASAEESQRAVGRVVAASPQAKFARGLVRGVTSEAAAPAAPAAATWQDAAAAVGRVDDMPVGSERRRAAVEARQWIASAKVGLDASIASEIDPIRRAAYRDRLDQAMRGDAEMAALIYPEKMVPGTGPSPLGVAFAPTPPADVAKVAAAPARITAALAASETESEMLARSLATAKAARAKAPSGVSTAPVAVRGGTVPESAEALAIDEEIAAVKRKQEQQMALRAQLARIREQSLQGL